MGESASNRNVISKNDWANFSRLASQSTSRDPIVGESGIEMTRDITVQHQSMSQAREPASNVTVLTETDGRFPVNGSKCV